MTRDTQISEQRLRLVLELRIASEVEIAEPPKPKRLVAQRRDLRQEMIDAHLPFLRVMRKGAACVTEKLRLLASLGPLQMSQPRLQKIRVHSAHSCSVGSLFFGQSAMLKGVLI